MHPETNCSFTEGRPSTFYASSFSLPSFESKSHIASIQLTWRALGVSVLINLEELHWLRSSWDGEASEANPTGDFLYETLLTNGWPLVFSTSWFFSILLIVTWWASSGSISNQNGMKVGLKPVLCDCLTQSRRQYVCEQNRNQLFIHFLLRRTFRNAKVGLLRIIKMNVAQHFKI